MKRGRPDDGDHPPDKKPHVMQGGYGGQMHPGTMQGPPAHGMPGVHEAGGGAGMMPMMGQQQFAPQHMQGPVQQMPEHIQQQQQGHPVHYGVSVESPQQMQGAPHGMVHGGGAPPPEQTRQLKVEDALEYLDRVKRQFETKPHIYNQFLDIMKSFKAQTIDTPGVIQQVSELFDGHPDLIYGFNTFLPPGYRIEIVHNDASVPQPQMIVPAPGPQPPLPHAMPMGQPLQPTRSQGQPPEFDHAIHYVTKIKKRFVSNPDVYKQFLQILHAYQQQQENISSVLDQVSELFADHHDLLMDFAYFLPDSIQSQAQDRLARSAHRLHAARGGAVSHDVRAAGEAAYLDQAHQQYMEDQRRWMQQGERERDMERFRSRHRGHVQLGMREGRSARGRMAALAARQADDTMFVQLPESERNFFFRMKAAMGGRSGWLEWLKCLKLYSIGVLTSRELIRLTGDILGDPDEELVEQLRVFLRHHGAVEVTEQDTWYSMPVGELDLSNCRQCTPSYRALPESYPKQMCSERGPLEKEVLNDTWVSVPTGSEDFSFKHMRRNQYEEALFRCEDERYEIDMVIETNASAIRALEPLAAEIEALEQASSEFAWQFRLDRRALGVVHLKAIARVYGEQGGTMLELLRKHPRKAIPTILRRLKEKDRQWRAARVDMNKQWKVVMERNYHKSLDHRSFYFKQSDKKSITPKAFLQEMRMQIEAAEAEVKAAQSAQAEAATGLGSGGEGDAQEKRQQQKQDLVESLPPALVSTGTSPHEDSVTRQGTGMVRFDKSGRAVIEPTLFFRYQDVEAHSDAFALLEYAAERYVSVADRVVVAALWRTFFSRFFGFRCRWMQRKPGADMPFGPGIFLLGDAVETPYGTGVVQRVRWGNHGVLSEDASLPERAKTFMAAHQDSSAEDSRVHSNSASASSAAGASKAGGKKAQKKKKKQQQQQQQQQASQRTTYASEETLPSCLRDPGAPPVVYEVLVPWGSQVGSAIVVGASSVRAAKGFGSTAAQAQAAPVTGGSGTRIGRQVAAGGDPDDPEEGNVRPLRSTAGRPATSSVGKGAGAAAGGGRGGSDEVMVDDDDESGTAGVGAGGRDSVEVARGRARRGRRVRRGPSAEIAQLEADAGLTPSQPASTEQSQEAAVQPKPVAGEGVAASASSSAADGGGSKQAGEQADTQGMPSSVLGLSEGPPPRADAVYIGSQHEYIFFRMHHLLTERLLAARRLCEQAAKAAVARHATEGSSRPGDASASGAASLSSSSLSSSRKKAAWKQDAAMSDDAGGVGTAAAEDAHEVESGERRFQLYLSALYALLDSSLDSSRYEDECRVLMGTKSYLLFTMDKLVQHTAKQLQTVAADATATKMRSLYEYHASRVAMIEATEPDAEKRQAASREALRVYRANAAAALTGRAEEWYLVQYAEDTAETRAIVADRLKRAKSNRRVEDLPWGAGLTIRFLGRPLYDPTDASLRHFSTEIPAYVGRLAGEGVILRGAIPIDDEEEQRTFDVAETEARRPFLARTLHSTVTDPSAQGATAGGVSSAGNGLRVGVTPEGQLRPHAGTEDLLHHQRQAGVPSTSSSQQQQHQQQHQQQQRQQPGRFAEWAESQFRSLESESSAAAGDPASGGGGAPSGNLGDAGK